MEKSKFRLLVGATGSVAALKIPILIDSLLKLNDQQQYIFEVIFINKTFRKNCLVYIK